jgi:O-antigen ligase
MRTISIQRPHHDKLLRRARQKTKSSACRAAHLSSFVTTPHPTPAAKWPAQLLALAAAGGAVLTVVFPSATRQFTWPWVLLLAFLWVAPLAAGLAAFTLRGIWTRPNGLLSAGLILLAAVTLLSAALSPFARLSLLRVWPTLGGVALFFWLHDWLAEPAGAARIRAGRIARGLALFGGGVALVSFGGWIVEAEGIWSTRANFPFGHATYTAGALVLILPWLGRETVIGCGLKRAGWGLVLAAALVSLIATGSRGGVMAAAAIGGIAAVLLVIRAAWSRPAKALTLLAAGVLLIAAVLANPRVRELVRHGGSEEAGKSNTERRAMLEAGEKLGAMRPLTGWGPGSVPLAYPKVRGQLSGGVDNVLQLHNSPAQLWATLGGGGVLALILLLAATTRQLARLVRQPAPLALTAAASVVGYGLFALTDHQLDLPAMNTMLVLNLALVFQGTGRPVAPGIGLRRGVLAAGLVVLAPLLLLTGRDLFARSYYEQSLTLFEHGRENDGLDYLNSAAGCAPYDPYYRHQLAARLLEKRQHTTEPAAQAQLTAAATAQLEESLAAGCLQEFAHFNLGWLALESGQPARAAEHFLATVREAPHRGGAYFGLGLAWRATGNQAGAVRAFALDWLNDPVNSTGPVWEWPDFAPLRAPVAREADELLAGLASTEPKAGYVRELWSWWAHGGPPPSRGFNAETATFAASLATLARDEPFPPATTGYGWGRLLGAWRQSPATQTFLPLVPRDGRFAATLARRAARHPAPDAHGFLAAGLENEPSLLLSLRPARTGYGVLALHPDGPILNDLYIMQENRLVSTFASTLFPAKGWIPARELLDRLPTPPASP